MVIVLCRFVSPQHYIEYNYTFFHSYSLFLKVPIHLTLMCSFSIQQWLRQTIGFMWLINLSD